MDKHKVESAGVKHLDDLFYNERDHYNEENRGSGKSLEMRQLTNLYNKRLGYTDIKCNATGMGEDMEVDFRYQGVLSVNF